MFKNAKMKDFLKASEDQAMVRAVIMQSGGWTFFKENAPDIARHGIDGGYHGWVYYKETVPFAKRHLKKIVDMLADMSADVGGTFMQTVLELGCMKSVGITELEIVRTLAGQEHLMSDCVLNCFAWFAATTVFDAFYDWADNQ